MLESVNKKRGIKLQHKTIVHSTIKFACKVGTNNIFKKLTNLN